MEFGTVLLRIARAPGRLLRALVHLIDTLVDTLHWQWVRRHRPPVLRYRGRGGPEGGLQVGPTTQHLFDAWERLVNEPYDPHRHHGLLRRLWEASFPEEEFSPISTRWTQVGFQSPDPASDFRGGGALSLKCIVYMAETYSEEYRRLSVERPLDAYYPFCASFVNVAFLLLDVIGLRNVHKDVCQSLAKNNRCTHAFLNRVVIYDPEQDEDPDDGAYEHPIELAFKELAVETMIELDRVFVEEGASYMDFPRVRGMVFSTLTSRMEHRSYSSSYTFSSTLRSTSLVSGSGEMPRVETSSPQKKLE